MGSQYGADGCRNAQIITAVLSQVLQLNPADPLAHCALGSVPSQPGDLARAAEHYRQALALKPDYAEARFNLAWIRAANSNPAFGNGEEAIQLARRACHLTAYRKPLMLGTLAAADAEAGRFEEAIATAQKARDLALAAREKELAERNQTLLDLYQPRRPCSESSKPAT